MRIFAAWKLEPLKYIGFLEAPVAELVDAPDLGSGVYDVQVRVLSGALFDSKNPKYDTKTNFL